jgi:truncated hemoglobin YjbI
MESLKKHMQLFLAAALGGLNRYGGKNMRDAHLSLNLDDMHFNVVKELMLESFKE